MKKSVGIIILVCLLVFVGILFFISFKKYNKNEISNSTDNELNNVEEVKNGQNIQNEVVTEDEEMILKVLDDIKNNTTFENILKSTDGDVTSEKLSKEEFENRKTEFVSKLKENMNLFKKYKEDGVTYVEYETEKVLNVLGFSSHMGVGTKQGIQIINLSGSNKMSKRGIISKVLDDIEKNTDFTSITKSIDGDVTAEKLSQREFIDNKNEYIEKLMNNINLFNIYDENGIQYVEYEVEKVLNELGFSSHMGVGIKHGIQKIKI